MRARRRTSEASEVAPPGVAARRRPAEEAGERKIPKKARAYWIDPDDEKRHVPLATGSSPVWSVSQNVPSLRDESVEEGSGWSNEAPAQASESTPRVRKPKVDWDNPALNVLERARLAAEEGWDERPWQDPQTTASENYEAMLPWQFRRRVKAATSPRPLLYHIEMNQLGLRKKRKWPKGEHRPKYFSGSDPAHNGMRDSFDDGKDSTIGRMAIAVWKGFLRHRAESFCGGLRAQPGVFPMAERPEVAFIGCSNTGKSSLLNAITRTMKLAEARDDPGVTRSINWYKCSRLPIDIIDLPGYGYAKGADFGSLLVDFIATRKALRTLYILVDARTGLRPRDWEWLQLVGSEGPQKIFILTKCDLVPPWDLGKVATIVLEDIRCVPKASQRLIMVSAREGQGMHDLRMDLCERAVVWSKRVEARRRRLENQLQPAPGTIG